MLVPTHIKLNSKNRHRYEETTAKQATHFIHVTRDKKDGEIFYNGYMFPRQSVEPISKLATRIARDNNLHLTDGFATLIYLKEKDTKRAKLEARAAAMREELDKLDREIAES